ncbi:MAG: carboxypeptidase-like regulatory domain-containing protein [bacterium]
MKRLFLFVILASVVLAAGCSDQRNVTLKSADNTGVITGRVIDFSTRSPIANATVILSTGGNNMVTKTISDNNPNHDLNRTGIFVFNGVPAGDYKLRIVATGYATVETESSLYYNDYTNTNNTVVVDYGNIQLYKGYNLDVYVDSNGTPVTGETIYTVRNSTIISPGCGGTNFYGSSYFYSPEIVATSDASGHATLSGLSQCERYAIVAPATDVNGDGIYDYQTSYVYYDGPTRSDTTLNINMLPAQRHDNIEVIATSADNYPAVEDWGVPTFQIYDYAYDAVAPNGDIVFVFNYPVSLDFVKLTLLNDFVENTDPNFGAILDIPVNAKLSAGNTVLTIHPTTNLLVNNTYGLAGNVSANISGFLQTYGLSNYFPYWYVFDNTATGIGGADFTVSADNFNGSVNGSGGAKNVYLKFPEWVYGRLQVIGYTKAGASTYYGAFGPTDYFSCYMIYEGNGIGGCEGTNCGPSGLKTVCFYDLTSYTYIDTFNDDSSFGGPSVNTVTVQIDVDDAEGNHFSGTLTLPVN